MQVTPLLEKLQFIRFLWSMNPKQQRFFDTALALIAEKGFKGTTMRDIAEALDFDVANAYNYIASKQSLLETFLFGISQEFHTGIDQVLRSGEKPETQLGAAISQHVRLAIDKPNVVSLLVNEWRHLKDEARSQFISERDAYEQKLQQIIEAGMKSGKFNCSDAKMTTHLVLSAVRWLHGLPQDERQKLDPAKLEREVLDFVAKGVS